MLPQDRLAIACLSYHRALAAARRRSSPASWRRLLTAARNLSQARRDREKHEGRGGGRAGSLRPHGARASRLAPVVTLPTTARRKKNREV